jgi:hypothetical protein
MFYRLLKIAPWPIVAATGVPFRTVVQRPNRHPARQYQVNGARHGFAQSRSVGDTSASVMLVPRARDADEVSTGLVQQDDLDAVHRHG